MLGNLTALFDPPETVETTVRKSKGMGSLKYPIESEYPAYIQYRIKEVLPASLQGASAIINKFKTTVPDKLRDADEINLSADERARRYIENEEKKSQYASAANDLLDNVSAAQAEKEKLWREQGGKHGLLGFKTFYPTDKQPIRLYFPQAVQVHDNVQYDQANLGTAAAAGLAALNRGGDVMTAIGEGAKETGKSLLQLFNLGSADAETGRLAVARAASLFQILTPASAQAGLGLALQVKVNPNTRSIFTGVTVRNFQFVYDFYPTSAIEAAEVNKIIKQFRETMYPLAIPENAVSNAGLPLGYKFPDLFEIKFKYGNDRNIQMPQPLLCFLRDCSTTYNPGSMSFFEDGNATHIQMSLSFQEFRALNKQDIEKGH